MFDIFEEMIQLLLLKYANYVLIPDNSSYHGPVVNGIGLWEG